MPSNGSTVISFPALNLIFFTQVLSVLTTPITYNDYATDKGTNITIPCMADGSIMWVKENGNTNTIVQAGKFLILTNVSTADGGLYVCFASVPTPATTIDFISSSNDNSKNISSQNIESSENALTTHIKLNYNWDYQDISRAKYVASTTTTSPLQQNSDKFSSEGGTEEREYEAFQKVHIEIRTTPGPVTQLYFRPSTILGFLVWRYNKSHSGGYPLRSFTAEFRNVSHSETIQNGSTEEQIWHRMDPVNIAPNVRQMEVYRLEPNTTYEFRIWANNELGSGDAVTTNITTLPETKEEDLIRLIQPELENFDPRVWILAVSIVLGTFVILAAGLCIILSKECYQSTHLGAGANVNTDTRDNITTTNSIVKKLNNNTSACATKTIVSANNNNNYNNNNNNKAITATAANNACNATLVEAANLTTVITPTPATTTTTTTTTTSLTTVQNCAQFHICKANGDVNVVVIP